MDETPPDYTTIVQSPDGAVWRLIGWLENNQRRIKRVERILKHLQSIFHYSYYEITKMARRPKYHWLIIHLVQPPKEIWGP